MVDRSHSAATSLGVWSLGLLLSMLLSTGSTPAQSFRDIMVFAADMAEKQNWNEASFRWKQALQQQPENPKVLNNLGVAAEATGRAEDALAYYESAVRHGKGDPNIWDNLLRFDSFWREQLGTEDGADGLLAPGLHGGEGKKLKGKTHRVTVGLPVPPRLELSGDQTRIPDIDHHHLPQRTDEDGPVPLRHVQVDDLEPTVGSDSMSDPDQRKATGCDEDGLEENRQSGAHCGISPRQGI